MITSTSNAGVKQVQALLKKHSLRDKEGVFVVEGLRMFREIPKSKLVRAYVTESVYKDKQNSDLFKGMNVETVTDQVMAAMSDTVNSQGLIAIVRQNRDNDIIIKKKNTYLMLDHLQDPGNLGTIIRMAEASGISAVIMSSDTVDIYNPKVVRSTMGAIFRVPFIYVDDLEGYIRKNREIIPVYGAALSESRDYADIDYTEGCAFVIGNEANGISKNILEACSGCVHIPMAGSVESLNAAIAASVLSFESFRQKRKKM